MNESEGDEVQRVPMPEGMSRPETGVMQFGDDWPGVFIRGDNAFHYAAHLKLILDELMTHPVPVAVELSIYVVTGLVDDLQDSDVRRLRAAGRELPPQ